MQVLPVTSGYRVTLTYNLIATNVVTAADAPEAASGSGGSRRRLLPTVQPLAGGGTPLVAKLRELMAQPDWQPEGATLGYMLGHKYASNFDELTDTMFPGILKGGDRLAYAALCEELGLVARFVPLHLASTVNEEEYRCLSLDEEEEEEEGEEEGEDEGEEKGDEDIRQRIFVGKGIEEDKDHLESVSMMYDIDMWLSLKDNARFDPLVVRRDVLWLGLGCALGPSVSMQLRAL
ncbi:hypothetical protein GPECTOR_1078g353 [Gonium pectorale]|uniref:Uncharacterized protein n=1 Tax=Gonium pectorale TaxID=33097 RepID=A0A150FTM5_GONPE|nr:hypothetical protein GPECTOR_1078g353 [Gonium pectorale]|eukprot:KXZ40973.1 hypothetical protein GPECTOR_1078g353 [Gonium pectorale]